jgi:hypothetical protein
LDSKGNLVAGKEESTPITEYIVWERALTQKNSAWRICGKIDPNKPMEEQGVVS